MDKKDLLGFTQYMLEVHPIHGTIIQIVFFPTWCKKKMISYIENTLYPYDKKGVYSE